MTTEAHPEYRKPYLDASVYIAAIKNEYGREVSGHILQAARQDRIAIVASTFIMAELVYGSDRPGDMTPEQGNVIEEMLLSSFVRFVELNIDIAVRARRIAREHRLKPPDAVHVAIALQAEADVFVSWDDHFLGRTVHGLACRRPYLAD